MGKVRETSEPSLDLASPAQVAGNEEITLAFHGASLEREREGGHGQRPYGARTTPVRALE